QRFCHTQSAEEIAELLLPLRERYRELGAPAPEMIVVDNCCAVRAKILSVFPDTHVVLDVWHCLKRYLNAVIRGTKNPFYKAVAHDITSAILEKRATESPTGIAIYYPQTMQKIQLEAAYQKWVKKNVWNASGASVHAEQMKHVEKGCLSRTRQDIRSDGSRIEGSHKGWNSLQRSFASGLEVMTALGHDFVLRRNLRTGLKCSLNTAESSTLPLEFILSAEGSHHVHLRNKIATTYNSIAKERKVSPTVIPQPELHTATAPETFGLVNSNHASTFGGLFMLKEEPDEDEMILLQDTENMIEIEEPIGHARINFLPVEPIISAMDKAAEVTTVHSVTIVAAAADLLHTTPMESTEAPEIGLDSEIEEKPVTQLQIHPFFMSVASNRTQTTMQSIDEATVSKDLPIIKTTSSIGMLTSPLPFRLDPARSLTRSQLLFESCSNIHPKSLIVDGDVEYHLFMEMRQEFQWVSYAMTPHRWVQATLEFNARLKAKDASLLPKLPRALSNKLGDIEKIVGERIATNNYTAKSGSDTFWKKHCFAVSLSRASMAAESSTSTRKTRKSATCARCQTIMYPGPSGSPENHKLGHCSDGVSQKLKSIPWPQPSGIFLNKGKTFAPVKFLQILRQVYDETVVQQHPLNELTMEYQAFAEFLGTHTMTRGNMVLFKLDSLGSEVSVDDTAPESLFVRDGTESYLRLECLQG
ncbi:hypothetical protein EV360DRAFT_57566, partial [Lentinula raphanica]